MTGSARSNRVKVSLTKAARGQGMRPTKCSSGCHVWRTYRLGGGLHGRIYDLLWWHGFRSDCRALCERGKTGWMGVYETETGRAAHPDRD